MAPLTTITPTPDLLVPIASEDDAVIIRSSWVEEKLMPYLRVTCPHVDVAQRRKIAAALTDAVVDMFTRPRGPSSADIRARTTVQFACYGPEELFVGGHAPDDAQPDVTVEVSDWSMSTRQQSRVAAQLTPVLVRSFGAEPEAVNMRFHSYPRPTSLLVALRNEKIARKDSEWKIVAP